MPTRDGYAEGTPSWVDLATPDLEGAKAFYSALFGWEYSEAETDSTPYVMATKNGLVAAGIGVMEDDVPNVWSTYFAVDNADVTAENIKKAGGSLLMEIMDIPGAGRMAFATDPTGAAFGIWEEGGHVGAAIVNEHGTLNWNELTDDDLETALAFYSEVFGHTHETSEMPGGPYTSISVGDRAVAGAMAPQAPNIPNHWGAFFAVDSTADAIETTKANGGGITYGPMDVPDVGTFAGITDPYGAHLTVIQLAQPVD